MEQYEVLQRLLAELQWETGISFRVSEGQSAEAAAVQVQQLLDAYRHSYNRTYLLRRILTDEMSEVELYQNAQKLHLNTEESRCVLLLRGSQVAESDVHSILSSMFSMQENPFLVPLDPCHLALIKSVRTQTEYAELAQSCHSIVDTLAAEAMCSVKIAYGTCADDAAQLKRSYQEARQALTVGRIFSPKENVLCYEQLGLGRLIYEIPLSVCKAYLTEIFGSHIPENLDDETIATIHKFFEHGLNISETARDLYIHRNTLIYRLEKLQRMTGLDIRGFDDAMAFKVATMILDYIQYRQQEPLQDVRE